MVREESLLPIASDLLCFDGSGKEMILPVSPFSTVCLITGCGPNMLSEVNPERKATPLQLMKTNGWWWM